ncbi:MAG: PH domain-containing protein [Gammaproteobacteria bacterium]|nr:PH domain-containing protein [Gammaproteobacteria bacterium]
MSESESVLWEGTPSHVRDLGYHAVCLLLAPLVVPLFLAFWRYLTTRCHRIRVSSERIQITTGVLSKRMEEIELYRVKDTALEQPFVQRLFGLANIRLTTSDPSSPRLLIGPIADAHAVRENLRGAVEKIRDRKRVREIDYS